MIRRSKEEIRAFSKVLDLYHREEYAKTLDELLVFAKINKSCTHIAHTMRGHIFLFELKNLEAAENELRQALEIRPSAKKASYYLFTVLLEQGRIKEAIDEGKRFHALRKDSFPSDDELLRDYRQQVNALSSLSPSELENIRHKYLTYDSTVLDETEP
ncbi:MAG: tetratricopeptide repeat protein [Vulcanimicrobiota bacterium]